MHALGCRGSLPVGRKLMVRWGSETLAPCLCVLDSLPIMPTATSTGLLLYYQWQPSAVSCLVSFVGQRPSLYSLCMKCEGNTAFLLPNNIIIRDEPG